MYFVLLSCGLGACPHRLDAGQRRTAMPPLASQLLPAEPAWTVALPSPPSAPGAIDRDRVYVPLQSGQLVSLDRETGATRWSVALMSQSAPVVADDTVYVSGAADLQALKGTTGDVLWTAPLDATIVSPVLLTNSAVVVITAPNRLLAISRNTGQVMWTSSISLGSPSPLLAADRSRVCIASGNRLSCYSLSDGAREWEGALPGTLSLPRLAEDRLFVGSTDNHLYALSATSGHLDWKWRLGGDVVGATFEGGIVYVAALDHILRALRAGSGNQIWKRQLSTRTLAPPAVLGGVVVVAGNEPMLATFNAATGQPISSLAPVGKLQGVPLIERSIAPFRVSVVAIMRDGRVSGFRSTGLMFREPAAVPLAALPGRALTRETLPAEGVR